MTARHARVRARVRAPHRHYRLEVCARRGAPLAPPGRPEILFGPGNQSRLHRIVLDIERNSTPLPLAPYPMIVRFPLPERLSGTAEQAIRFPSRVTLSAISSTGSAISSAAATHEHGWPLPRNRKARNVRAPPPGARTPPPGSRWPPAEGTWDQYEPCPIGGPARRKPGRPRLCGVAGNGTDECCREGAR